MIYLGIAIRSPFTSVTFRNYWSRWWRVPGLKHKNFELEFVRTENLVHLSFDINPWHDHGGFSLMFGLLHHEINCNFYDTRHWDRDHHSWK
jgi:hypothetical protein